MEEETTLLPDYINASDPDHKSVDEECRFRNVAQVKARTREEEQEIVGGNNGSVEPEKNAPGKEHDVRHEVPPNEEASEDYQYHPSCENAEGDIQNLTGRAKEAFALRLKVTDTEQEQYSLASEASESTTTSLHSNGAWRQVDSMARQFVGNDASDHCEEVSKMEPFSRDLQAVKCIFRQDVVRSNKTGAIGIVTEVAGDSDSDGSISADEDDEDDEDEDEDVGDEQGDGVANTNASESNDKNNGQREYKCADLQEDQVRVIWLGPTEPVHSFKDLTVLDREFLHGDYVASASDPTGQIGVVVDVNISVDLLAQDDSYTIKDVSTKEIKRVREFAVGDYVVLGPWLGRVDDVFDNVTVLFDDGSVCKVVRAEPTRLRPFLPFEDNGHVPYHPGQRVRASSSSVFKNSRWLSGLWKANRLEGTVTKVTPGSVFVYWIASSGYGPDSSTSPAEEQNPKNLKLLSCFVHANWQVFDWCLLPSSSQSSSIALDKDISKSRSGDTIKSKRKYGWLGSGTSSKEVNLDESNEAVELLHVDTKHLPSEGNRKAKASPESSTCSSSLFVSKEPVHEPWPLHRKKIRKVVIRKEKKLRKKEENFEKALLIVNSKTKVDVAWQDGTIECGIESSALIPIDTPGDQEFVAEQYVVEKSSDDVGDAHEPRHVGVVRSVNAKERTASIRWLKPVARAEDPREFDREEIVSVYEIEGHPDYDYCYGDVVVRLCPVSSPKESASGGVPIEDLMQQSGPAQPEQDPKHCGGQDVEDASGNGDSMAFDDLSWVGNITGLKNGDIEVTWANGMVSMVGPQAIYVVGRDDDESVVGGSEVGDDAASWETVDDDDDDGDDDDDINQMETHDTTQQELGRGTNSGTGETLENNTVRNAAMSLSLAALDFMSRLASGLFSGRRKNVDVADKDHEVKCQGILDNSDEKSSQGQPSSNKSGVVDDYIGESMDETGKEQVSTSAHEFSVSAKSSSEVGAEESEHGAYTVDSIWSFKRFDISKDPVDHYFLGASGQDSNGRKWLKKVQQDWNILQNNLPEGIYVRVYEDRMDLLRAVIIGAYGTPYQDGLFFFDFHLPPEYPDVPPSAYYHSGGWRINPNLYEEGKVCLSLLNTWTGRGNEVWDPISSSILQVLVSLQGLVLNSKPYFNEAGYDKQIGTAEGEKNSLAYNENTFLLNCKTMMYLMRKPPKDFEDLIRQHFKRRGYYVLKACNTYMKGYLIGSLAEDASVGDHETANFTSVGFKLMLGKIMPKLILALNEVGADCHEFEHRQQSS